MYVYIAFLESAISIEMYQDYLTDKRVPTGFDSFAILIARLNIDLLLITTTDRLTADNITL